MFKIESSLLQEEVTRIKGASEKASLAKGHIFVTASHAEQTVALYFVGKDLQVQKTIEAKVAADGHFAVVASEFALKVSALPKEVMVDFVIDKKVISLVWGRNSNIQLQLAVETAPAIEIPETVVNIKWPAGTIGYFTRNFTPFAALPNSSRSEKFPTVAGVHFSKNDLEQLVVEATNGSRSIINEYTHEWFEEGFSIPVETLLSVNAVMSSESEIEIGLNEQRTLLVIKCANTVALSRILSGAFPNVANFYTNGDAKIVWRADRMELLETARRAKKLCAGSLDLEPVMTMKKAGKQHFVVLPNILTEQVGAMVESDVAEDIVLHANNLEAALTVLRAEEVLLTFNEKEHPLTVSSGDEESAETMRVMVAQMQIN